MKILVAAATIAIALSTTANAQVSDTAPSKDKIVVDGQKDDPDPNKVVCKTDRTLGSRLNSSKRCMTRRQWDAERASNRQYIEKAQAERPRTEG